MSVSIWDRLSKKYDRLWVQKYSLAPTREAVILIIEKLEAGRYFRILDLGCGTGQLIERLRHKYPESDFVGVDKSWAMVELARAKNSMCTFYTSDIVDWKFSEEPFDVVVCCHSFPYFSDKKAAVKRVREVLKQGGHAIFVQASVNTIYDRIVMWFVEKTAESAQYFSKKEFAAYFSDEFDIIDEFVIKKKWYMPNICGFVFRRKNSSAN